MAAIMAIGLLASSVVAVAAQDPDPANTEPAAASHFTGTLHLGGDIVDAGTETMVDGGVQARGFTEAGLVIDTSDPRLNGSLTRAINVNLQFMGDEERVAFKSDSWRIDNEAGSWTGQGSGFLHAGANIAREDETQIDTLVLTGEGGYAGLTAYVIVSGLDGTVEGIVLAGDPPPHPENDQTVDAE